MRVRLVYHRYTSGYGSVSSPGTKYKTERKRFAASSFFLRFLRGQCVRKISVIVTPLGILGIGSQWLLTMRARLVYYRCTIGYSSVSFPGVVNSVNCSLSDEASLALPLEKARGAELINNVHLYSIKKHPAPWGPDCCLLDEIFADYKYGVAAGLVENCAHILSSARNA